MLFNMPNYILSHKLFICSPKIRPQSNVSKGMYLSEPEEADTKGILSLLLFAYTHIIVGNIILSKFNY